MLQLKLALTNEKISLVSIHMLIPVEGVNRQLAGGTLLESSSTTCDGIDNTTMLRVRVIQVVFGRFQWAGENVNQANTVQLQVKVNKGK